MNMVNFKPDLGYYLLETYGKEINNHFYSVKLFHIIHVGKDLYSSTSNAHYDDNVYAATFDFSTDKLDQLLELIENKDFAGYLKSKLKKEFTEVDQVNFDDNPITIDITAELGTPVKSLYETFIPLIVTEFSNGN